MTRRLRWIVGVIVLVALAIPVGTYAYIHWFSDDAPERLTLDTRADAETSDTPGSDTTVALAGGLSGTWAPHASSSQVGYRVNEVLLGQAKEAVGRTSAVTGTMVIDGTTVSSVSLTADMTKVTSDQDRRDGQFQGRIMDTARYPTATFELTTPITLPSVDATTVSTTVTGKLTLHGTTKTVTFDLAAKRGGATIEVNGTIPVLFADYGIPNPTFGPVSTEDHGELEFLVAFTKSAA